MQTMFTWVEEDYCIVKMKNDILLFVSGGCER